MNAAKPENSAQGKRGRKPASESRAVEIRSKLLAWKQTPGAQRISLRALAVKLGVSHQLLSSYLAGLNNWQEKDYQRRAETIRNLAKAENRYTTSWEESQAATLERAAFHCMIESVLISTLKRYEADLQDKKRGSFRRHELKLIKMLAQRGVPMAQKLLEKCQINLPPKPIHAS